ncbi:hypothetical protein L596_028173 [Steinernema carpocapsae]|uniref:Uncharacterized protein n=1 Tax=Steinernema carpocapsae TaxID=34508 RepID=A0A4U5LXN2_STECR|nr:hypothetical protein L596_028173 [Steinernema carpocapsae]
MAGTHQEISAEQEEALKHVPEASKRETLRVLIAQRKQIHERLDELEMGFGDNEEEDAQAYEDNFARYDRLQANLVLVERRLKDYAIPFEDVNQKQRERMEDEKGPIKVDFSGIPQLDAWLENFVNTEPKRNIASGGIAVTKYSRPTVKDILEGLEEVKAKALGSGDGEVLNLAKEHVGESQEKFAIDIISKISEMFKKHESSRIDLMCQAYQEQYRMPEAAVEEPPEFKASTSEATPISVAAGIEAIKEAIESGEIERGTDDDEGDDLEIAEEDEDQEDEEEREEQGEEKKTEEEDAMETGEGTKLAEDQSAEDVEDKGAKEAEEQVSEDVTMETEEEDIIYLSDDSAEEDEDEVEVITLD